jgi:hypothetical protein
MGHWVVGLLVGSLDRGVVALEFRTEVSFFLSMGLN